MHLKLLIAVLLVGVGAGCTGRIGEVENKGGQAGGPPGGGVDPSKLSEYIGVGASGLRRLTRAEYDDTLRDLLGDTTRSGFAKLPEDTADPFDNDYKTQQVSGTLVEAVETLAQEASARALADPVQRAKLVSCAPQGPSDAACMRQLITELGRRAFRRPLQEEDIQRYLTLQAFAVEAQDFFVGVDLVVRAMLQDPEFLYRVEIGAPVAGKPGVFLLNPFEVATRLSYFVLGSTPPDSLIDLAAANKLASIDDRRAAAQMLLADRRARDRVDSFHALWLSYAQLPHPPELTSAMRSESAELVARVVFDQPGDYFELFRSQQTFVNDFLADHYGLPQPGSVSGAWVSYGNSPRRGILSHGSVLSAGAKFEDTSPTLRGIFVRTRLLCETIPPPPPNVQVDKPPMEGPSHCKVDRYASHSNVGSCHACHQRTDPVGFGLEAYDRTGAFRTHDDGAADCPISGDGELVGVGKFNGPAGLGELLIASGGLEACVVKQLYRYAMGRRELADDQPTLDLLTALFRQRSRSFEELIIDTVASAAFVHRTEE